MVRVIVCLGVFVSVMNAQAVECLQDEPLHRLDMRYEQALQTGDSTFLAGLLADDFVWVHNLGSDIENREALLQRMARKADLPLARATRELRIHRSGRTAVLIGISAVTRPGADDGARVQMDYRFMRTYVAEGQHCRLLAVQTMKVWTGEPAE